MHSLSLESGHPAELHPSPAIAARDHSGVGHASVLRQTTPSYRLTGKVLAGLVAMGDSIALTAPGVALVLAGIWPIPTAWLAALPVAVLVVLLSLFGAGHYASQGQTPRARAGVMVLVIAGVLAAAAIWGIGDAADQSMLAPLAVWLAGASLLLAGWRIWLARRVRRWRADGHLVTRVAVLGANARGLALMAALGRASNANIVQAVGLYDDAAQPGGVDGSGGVDGYCVADLAELYREVAADRVDAVVVALLPAEADRLAPICLQLRQLVVDVWQLADATNPVGAGPPRQLVPGTAVWPIWHRPLGAWDGVIKRAADLILGSLLLVAFLPVMLASVLLVALDSRGPVLLRQRRFGYASVPFSIYKIRTMYYEQQDISGARSTVRGDVRVTRIGRFLRATSIDELPQLLNVLRGEMSLVGPRPHPIEMVIEGRRYQDVVAEYFTRHSVKPGITGLAQISGARGLVDSQGKAQRRVDLDIAYISRWSLRLDIKILWRTLGTGFVGTGAF